MKLFEKIFANAGIRLVKNSEYDKLIYASKTNYGKMSTVESSMDQYDVMKKLIPIDNPLIFDVGAYIGTETKKYLNNFKCPKIYSFEPYSMSFAELKKNLCDMDNVKAINAAVCDKNGEAVLNVGDFTPTNSLLKGDNRADSYWGEQIVSLNRQEKVKTVTIDSFCLMNDVDKIDILKLDVQGNELAALKGADQMLSTGRVQMIISEVLFVPTYQNQADFAEVCRFMADKKYILYNMFNMKSVEGRLNQVDIIFLKESANV